MDNLHYDAFISYRHTQVDSFVAKKIHHMLEHYKIPKKYKKNQEKRKLKEFLEIMRNCRYPQICRKKSLRHLRTQST